MTQEKFETITPRATDFSEWYQDVISAADLAEHSQTRGCMIIKPTGYAIWEQIQRVLDRMIKETGHKNMYFPLLIPLRFLEKEAEHVEGFAKECAVVTHYRLENDGHGKLVPAKDAELQEPLIIRPTSEAIIGDAMSRWVQSYRDLPILLNQWCNVMRWEMRTRLFLRTAEFLWQEGHTAHATQKEAVDETLKMLAVYEKLAYEYLAIPMITGEKTPAERFPGAVDTYTIEAMMQDGKALQCGTSHFLGQNFAKAYGIQFSSQEHTTEYAWTTSWGLTTRLIGALIMVHSDDDGLVLPPRIAPDQIVLIPFIKDETDTETILAYCDRVKKDLEAISFGGEPLRVFIDNTGKRATLKFWDAVKKGVPVRLEVGMWEIAADSLALSRRDEPAKQRTTVTRPALLAQIGGILEGMQSALLEKARAFREANTYHVSSVEELKAFFEDGKVGFVMAFFDPLADSDPAVEAILKDLKVTTRCVPLTHRTTPGTCIFTGHPTTSQVIFAKAY